MSIKIKNNILKSSDYTYSLILFSNLYDNNVNYIDKIIYLTIKGFLNLFSIEKLGNFLSGIIISGVFKKSGIVSSWLKNKCKTLIIYQIPSYQLTTLIDRCKEFNIPYYEQLDLKSKSCLCLYIGPYWTNKLYYNLDNRIIYDNFDKILNIKNE